MGSTHLSETERKRFDAMANFSSIREAATSLGLSPNTLYNWRLSVKKRYRKERGHLNAVLAQTRRGGCLKDLLKVKHQMAPPDKEDEEEDEEF